jgi:DNA-binding GntR family transcriptional regulator
VSRQGNDSKASAPKASGTKAVTIADALRETIATGGLDDGARLYQDQLAEQFETSITPVREALKMLQAEGLLVSEPHRGVRVAFPDLDQIASIYVMRRLVEPFAARRSARRVSRLDLERARRINEEFGNSDEGNMIDARRLNQEFHFTFYRACGLPTLASEIERLWTGFPWAALQVHRGKASSSYEEHLGMIEAIEGVDEEAIQTVFETHIFHGFEALVEHIGVTLVADPFTDDDRARSLKEDSWWKT